MVAKKLMAASAVAMLTMVALGGENGNGAKKSAPVPKPDPAVLKIIKDLPENTATILPAPKIAGEFNELAKASGLDKRVPDCRDFSPRMVYDPFRKTAIYFGCDHSGSANDTWEYSLAANTWTLVHGPDLNGSRSFRRNPAAKKLKAQDWITRDGIMTGPKGYPMPGHVYQGVTYDPQAKRVLHMCRTWLPGMFATRLPKETLEKLKAGCTYKGPTLWAFDPARREWKFLKTEPPYPRRRVTNLFVHVPEIGKSIYTDGLCQVWLYDSGANKWERLPGAKPKMSEPLAAWDPENKVLVLTSARSTYHFDPAAKKWTLAVDGTDGKTPREQSFVAGSGKAPFGTNNTAILEYDSASKVFLLAKRAGTPRWNWNKPAGVELWAYSAKARKWTRLKPGGKLPERLRGGGMGYYDAEHNVFVAHYGRSVLVYRFKRAKKGEAK
jgi:hypothetical protein